MIRASFLALAAAAVAVSSAQAIPLKCDPKFDFNGNGYVEIGNELEVCKLHERSAIFGQFDTNLNGHIDPDEAVVMDRKVRDDSQFIAEIEDAKALLQDKPGIPVEKPKPDTSMKPASASGWQTSTGFLVRKAYDPIGVFSQLDTPLARVSGADVSFTDDFAGGNKVVSASGAVEAYRTWTYSPDGTVLPTGITEGAVHFGAEFNRKINSSSAAHDIDSLTLRAGGEVGIQGPGTVYSFVRGNIFDATDFNFDAHVVGGEAEWEPVYLPAGIGVARKVTGLPVYFRWRPTLHAEYETVLDSGNSATLTQGDNYLFVGPVLTGQLWFADWLERLSLDTTYWAMWDAVGTAQSFQYFDIGANWRLDDIGHVALTAKYRNGRTPKTREQVNDVTLGLTAKF
jgi:hypothetical protein